MASAPMPEDAALFKNREASAYKNAAANGAAVRNASI